jgi:hypothetical protein
MFSSLSLNVSHPFDSFNDYADTIMPPTINFAMHLVDFHPFIRWRDEIYNWRG